jgi:hypothetical protein
MLRLSAASRLSSTARGRRTLNSLPLLAPSLGASTRSTVHLREPARQSKADPEAALVAAARAITAAEHLEQLFRWLLLSLDRLKYSDRDAGTDCGHARCAP